MFTKTCIALAGSAVTLSVALLMSPMANADDGNCSADGTISICDSNGSAALVATPPKIDSGFQNGSYGPAGNEAPVGGQGLN